MLNPFQRLLEQCGISQIQFRERFGFSAMTMRYILDGRYVSLSDRMVLSLGELCHEKGVDARQILLDEYAEPTLQDAYQQWQIDSRRGIAAKYHVEPSRWSAKKSPFEAYIEATAGTQWTFCKELKLDAAAVRRYANGQSVSMPIAIEHAMREIEYPYLRNLLEAQRAWRDEHIA